MKTAMQELIDYVVWISNQPQIEDPLLDVLAFAELQLKEKERQQILDSYFNGKVDRQPDNFIGKERTGEQYYNETYGNE